VAGTPLPPADDEHIVLAESEVVLAEIESLWPQIVDDMKPYNPRLQAVLKSCEPTTLEDTMLVIGTPSPFHNKQMEEQANRRLLEDVISKRLGQPILVRCELVNKEQQSKTRDARRQREELMKDQIVKAARNIFDARIVGVQEDG
jgi:DNA polymerase-3 subunit gamma/tau